MLFSYDSGGDDTGTTGTTAATNPWTYAGGYNDTTSNPIKFGARYYRPAGGRLTQPDPSGKEQNRYNYVGCNPINATDPSGLFTFGEAVGIGIGFAIPAVVTGLACVASVGGVPRRCGSFWCGLRGCG